MLISLLLLIRGRISFYLGGIYFLEVSYPLDAGFLGITGRLNCSLLRGGASDLLSFTDRSDVVSNILVNELYNKREFMKLTVINYRLL